MSITNTKNTSSLNHTNKKEHLKSTWNNSNFSSSVDHDLNQEQRNSNIASTVASSLGLSTNPAASTTAISNTHLPETQAVNLANHDKKVALADSHANASVITHNTSVAHVADSINQHLPSVASTSTLTTAAADNAIGLAANSAAAPAYTATSPAQAPSANPVITTVQAPSASPTALPTYLAGGGDGVTSSRSSITTFDPIADITAAIDVKDLLASGAKWGDSALGALNTQETHLTYSFFSKANGSTVVYNDVSLADAASDLNANQKSVAREILAKISNFTNVSFSEMVETSTSAGDVRLMNLNDVTKGGVAATAFRPSTWAMAGAAGGDVRFLPSMPEPQSLTLKKGGQAYEIFVHELGHALGLGHPHESDISTGLEQDQIKYSVMSYKSSFNSNGYFTYGPSNFMLNDIAALQALYGADFNYKDTNGDGNINDTYKWADKQQIFETIYDAGGIDTIDASNQSQAVIIDLNPGKFSTIGGIIRTSQTDARDYLAMAYEVKDANGNVVNYIENATGTALNDTLIGNAASNNLQGGAGDDTLQGGAGNDILDGGAGSDAASYAESTSAVTVNLSTGKSSGGSGIDTLSNIERVLGSIYNDTLIGDAGSNVLQGGTGNDTLDGGAGVDQIVYAESTSAVTVNLSTGKTFGGAGVDTLSNIENIIGSSYADTLTGNAGDNTLQGGAGNDILDGGAGVDQIVYAESTSAVTVNLSTGKTFGGAGVDTLSNIENIIGSSYADTLTGNAGDNALQGGDGDDILQGGAGNDTLDGGAGSDAASYTESTSAVTVNLSTGKTSGGAGIDTLSNIENIIGSSYADTLIGDAGNNVLRGGDGNDTLDGGAGSDAASYAESTSAVTVNLSTGKSSGGAGVDTLINMENIIGSSYADTLIGDAGNNVLQGGAGNDTLDGGAGVDQIVYAESTSAVTVNLSTGKTSGGAGIDTLSNIERVLGSIYNDTLIGDAGDNSLEGGDGDDTLQGGAGNDTLDGGAGSDAASYAESTSAVTVNLSTGKSSGGAGVDTLINMENIIGSSYADTLIGDAGANVLQGGAGNDALDGGAFVDAASYAESTSAVTVNLSTGKTSGGAGVDTLSNIENIIGSSYADTLIGDAGDNILQGGAGGDTLDGGEGSRDAASYAESTSAVMVNLSTGKSSGGAGVDTLISIENVIGSSYADTLMGDAGDNHLEGGDGDDTLQGGAGGDWLDGGAGIDTTSYAESASAVKVNLNIQWSYDGTRIDTLENIENIIGSSYDDTLIGDKGNNVLQGGAGNDTLDGGAGSDAASYTESTSAVTVNLSTGKTSGGAGIDTLSNIENIIGSSYADTLMGDAGGNVLEGGSGDDILQGGAGDDTLNGGGGGDSASYAESTSAVTVNLSTGKSSGGAGVDTLISIENIIGSSYADTLTGNAGDNVLQGGAGNDTLDGGMGSDTLYGGDGNDKLYSVNAVYINKTNATFDEHGNNTLYGGNGDDDLYGSEGANNLYGDAGKDVLFDNQWGADFRVVTNPGINKLFGGAGDDRYYVTKNNTQVVENANEGRDAIYTMVDYTLPANCEDLVSIWSSYYGVLYGAPSRLTGNELDNTINATDDSTTRAVTLSGLAGNDQLYSGSLNDTLLGGDGNDWLSADAGADTLQGGAGNDTLFGGSGADLFVFSDALLSTNKDTITDFNVVGDTIQLSRSIFSAISAGTMAAASFKSGVGLLGGQDANDYIVYNTSTGNLYYDSDGSGSLAAICFAQCSNLAALSYQNFVIV